MSSIKTAYLSAVAPPGPFASVGLASRDGSAVIANCAAQIDTAADRTVVPRRFIEQLGAAPIREVELVGFGGAPVTSAVFEVWLMLPTFQPVLLEVTTDANEPWILLGRDYLNRYKILLDGPSLQVVIEEP
jgi:predicted aspartyl protease